MRLSLKKLSPEAMRVLGAVQIDGLLATLPRGQLERKLYTEVDGALRAVGGQWNRAKKAHVFTSDPEEPLSELLALGGYTDQRQEWGFFPTPQKLAQKVVDIARILPGMSVLEPSAGLGALVVPCLKAGAVVTMVEPQSSCRRPLEVLCSLHPGTLKLTNASDFLTWKCLDRFDRVVMNPPFRGQADIDHVTKAVSLLKPGGLLVAIMSGGVKFRTNRKAADFREFVDLHDGSIGGNPPGSFAESGTNVQTVTVVIPN